MPRFEKGNDGGPGGSREGSGRKSNVVKQALELLLAGREDQARAVLDAAMKIPDPDELLLQLAAVPDEELEVGATETDRRSAAYREYIRKQAIIVAWKAKHAGWRDRIRAAEHVLAYLYGRPLVRVDHNLSGDGARSRLDSAERSTLAAVAELGRQFQSPLGERSSQDGTGRRKKKRRRGSDGKGRPGPDDGDDAN